MWPSIYLRSGSMGERTLLIWVRKDKLILLDFVKGMGIKLFSMNVVIYSTHVPYRNFHTSNCKD